MNEHELGHLGARQGISDRNKYVIRASSGHTVDQSRWSGIHRGQMRKGRWERQAGSEDRGLDFGIEEFRPPNAEENKESSE